MLGMRPFKKNLGISRESPGFEYAASLFKRAGQVTRGDRKGATGGLHLGRSPVDRLEIPFQIHFAFVGFGHPFFA